MLVHIPVNHELDLVVKLLVLWARNPEVVGSSPISTVTIEWG